MLFLLTTFILFWSYLLIVPIPRLEVNNNADTTHITNTPASAFIRALRVIKDENKSIFYSFEENLDEKRDSAVFLYALLTFGFIFIFTILFHWKGYILFPLILASIVCLVMCSLLWYFTNSIDKSIYLDIQKTIDSYRGLKLFRFLGIYLFVELFIIVFGAWYNIPE